MAEYDDEDHRDRLAEKPIRRIKASELEASEIAQDYLKTFSWSKVGEPLKTTVKNHIARLHANEPSGYGALFYGRDYGHGKTTLAIQCMVQAMSRGAVGGYFYEPYDLNMIFTQPWNYPTQTGKSIAQKLLDVQILVLDEVGEEITFEKNRAWFKKLMRHRYNKRLVTYLTSNAGPDFYEKSFPWFTAILAERFQIINVKDTNHRVEAAKKNLKREG